MNKLKQWQDNNCISAQAMAELSVLLGLSLPGEGLIIVSDSTSKSETAVQTECRMAASTQGNRLWRNNVGVAQRIDKNTGKTIPVRYGLCNESKQMNKRIKSSDLIGIKRVLITQNMVGTTIGQFWAPEIKKGDWVYTGTKRELAQLKFHQIVNDLGGCAKFVNDVGKL